LPRVKLTGSTAWGRRAWKRLAAALAGRRRALIVTHDYPDPDALASGWAMVQLLGRKLGIRSRLVYGGSIERPENRTMVGLLGVPAHEISPLDFSGRPALITVDCSPGSGNNPLEAGEPVAAVLDSHRGALELPGERRLGCACTATSTLAAELCWAARLHPSRALATALFYGIKTDTQALRREATAADEAAYCRLFPLIDARSLAEIEGPALPQYTYTMLFRALADARTYGHAIVAGLGRLESRDGPAEAADYLARLDRARYALAHGWWEGAEIFSVRTWRRGSEAWKLARAAAGGEGGAGGHDTFAGGSVRADTAGAAARAGRRIELRFLRAVRAGIRHGRKLIPDRKG
jgi:nanoRNase/pAp phosphatase (c-di-AMP/oligoRNAs hydrolase)